MDAVTGAAGDLINERSVIIMQFEKVSLEVFNKAMGERFGLDPVAVRGAWDDLILPVRYTHGSAGYDFHSPVTFCLPPGQSIVIPSGVKCFFSRSETRRFVLKLYNRSSVGINDFVLLTHGTGIIDADYYNNPSNEGHIMIPLHNFGNKHRTFKKGERLVQGIFEDYSVTANDGFVFRNRTGGIGSTGK
jgi:dUTP pyrophosphatase